MKRRELVESAGLLAIWIATIATVWPRGNFPLHDDWDFAVATWNFTRTGHFHFTQFTAVSLRAQVLWGAVWTRLFGQSFEVLRLSTLTLSAATLLIVHRILVRASVEWPLRIVAPLALLFHPIFLWASCTYMTDVPYLFASVVSFYFFLRAFEEDRLFFVVLGCAATMVSWFIRQTGVVNAVAALLLFLLWRRRWRSAVGVIAGTLAAFAFLLIFKRDWLSGTPAMFALHYQMWGESTFRLPEQIGLVYHYVIFNAMNCALFFLPITLPLVFRRPSLALFVVALPIVWRACDLASAGYLMPYASRHLYSDILPGPIVFDWGVGPPNLTDVFSMGYDYPFRIAIVARLLLTLVAAIVAAFLIWSLLTRNESPTFRFAVISIAAGTAVLCGSGYYYDRYSLDSAWAVIIAVPFLIPWQKRIARISAVVLLLLVAFFSTFAVQEYFAWNRARWNAFNALRAQEVRIDQIDGGTEPWSYYELANADRRKARRGHPPRPYLLAFRPLPGYRVVAVNAFEGFAGLRRGAIYTLAKLSV